MHGVRKWLYPAAMLPAAAIAVLTALGTSPASAGNLNHRPGGGAARPLASVATAATPGFKGFSNTFTTGKGNFCDNTADAPCDGNAGAGDYGTADSVPAGFSNGGFGNYAPGGATALPTATTPLPRYALLSGTTAANQGLGCQTPGTEGCTGPYMEQTAANRPQYAFPSNGYTVTVYQWIDPAYTQGSSVTEPAQIDTDLGINQVSGTTASYGQDEIISTCISGGTANLSFGHGSPGTCGTAGQITTPGWYRYVFLVNDVGGNVFLDARVLNEAGTTILFDSGPQEVSFDGGATQATISDTGGLRYLWWPTLNVSGLPVGYVSYFAGQEQRGHGD